MEKNKMKYISKITEEILKEDEKARIDDFILYSKVIRKNKSRDKRTKHSYMFRACERF